MIKLQTRFPLEGQYAHEGSNLDFKEITRSNCSVVYLKEPEVNKELITNLKKLLNRKRPFLIYIESTDNHIIKDELKDHPKKHMISYIYDFMQMNQSGKMTIYDFIRVDLEGNLKYWDKLLKFSEKIPCVYIVKNAPDLTKVRTIPSNYRFEYASDKQEV